MTFQTSADPRRAAKRRDYLTCAVNGQRPGAQCHTSERILNRRERRASGWRGPLPEPFKGFRDKHRRYRSSSPELVRGKLDRLAARLGIDA